MSSKKPVEWLQLPCYMLNIEERRKILAEWKEVRANAKKSKHLPWKEEEEKAFQAFKRTLPR